jgi:hypothetical protein
MPESDERTNPGSDKGTARSAQAKENQRQKRKRLRTEAEAGSLDAQKELEELRSREAASQRKSYWRRHANAEAGDLKAKERLKIRSAQNAACRKRKRQKRPLTADQAGDLDAQGLLAASGSGLVESGSVPESGNEGGQGSLAAYWSKLESGSVPKSGNQELLESASQEGWGEAQELLEGLLAPERQETFAAHESGWAPGYGNQGFGIQGFGISFESAQQDHTTSPSPDKLESAQQDHTTSPSPDKDDLDTRRKGVRDRLALVAEQRRETTPHDHGYGLG